MNTEKAENLNTPLKLLVISALLIAIVIGFTIADKEKAEEKTEEVPTVKTEEVPTVGMDEIEALAKCVYGEARGCSDEEMKMVVHTVLNRVSSSKFPNTIMEVLTQKGQFVGYREEHPILDNIREIVLEALEEEPPSNIYSDYTTDYLFFSGKGGHNWFRRDY